MLNGNLEDITIEGVSDVIERLEQKPKSGFLFTVCLHHFLGSDLERIYDELGKIDFLKFVLSDVLWIRSCERVV